MTTDPCHLHFLHQGRDPSSNGDCPQPPYRLGLLAQTNSNC